MQTMADITPFKTAVASEECPGCRLNWMLFHPVQIDGHPTMRRCVECKRVYVFTAEEVKN